MPTIREKACGYYRDEDIRLLGVATPEGDARPDRVRAVVRGHTARHHVRLEGGTWSCSSCGPVECAHVASVQMVTGYSSAATKPKKKTEVTA